MKPDSSIAAAVVALYFVLAAVLLPPAEYPRALGGEILLFGGITAAGRWLGRGRLSWFGVFAVELLAGGVLLVPALPAMGGSSPAALAVGFLGMQAAVLWWATLRWDPPPAAAMRTSLAAAWRHGLLAAALLSAFASVPILLAWRSGDAPAGMLWVYPAYFAGTVAAATCYWLLQRIAHLATGRYLIGVLGGVCVYGAFAPLVAVIDPGREPLSPGLVLGAALACGVFVGPAVALGLRGREGGA